MIPIEIGYIGKHTEAFFHNGQVIRGVLRDIKTEANQILLFIQDGSFCYIVPSSNLAALGIGPKETNDDGYRCDSLGRAIGQEGQ